MTIEYTYTIFDGYPNSSGPCSWPHAEDVAVEADSAEQVFAAALARAETEGRQCGEYDSGDKLWVSVWDEDAVLVGTRTVVL